MKKFKIGLSLLMSLVMVFSVFSFGAFAAADTEIDTIELNFNAKPGDIYALDYTVTNEGNKSADVRETFVIRSSVAMSATPEFEIYAANSVAKGADGTYAPKSGAKPVVNDATTREVSTDKKTITYYLPEYVLNGTGTAAEIEAGVTSNAKTFDYVVLFSKTAANTFQGAELTIDYLAEAKQHRNTDSTVWTTVASEQITFAGGSVKAVPAA